MLSNFETVSTAYSLFLSYKLPVKILDVALVATQENSLELAVFSDKRYSVALLFEIIVTSIFPSVFTLQFTLLITASVSIGLK